MLLILLLGGTAFLAFAPWVAAAVVLLLTVVVLSYRQLVKAYPSGGGDYEVARKNIGEVAGLIVASALLVDYVLTVAVSVASGVDNIISAFPMLNPFRVELAIVCLAILMAVNLRGVRESGKAFAAPTYLFIVSIAIMIITAVVEALTGHSPVAESAAYNVKPESVAQVAFVLLLLRAFSSGCSALTGVEAVSNGVQAFRHPKVKNAQKTLVLMGSIAIVLFVGLVAVALISRVHYATSACDLIGFKNCLIVPQRSLIAQVAASTFGGNSVMFFVVQATTALVLLLAANTAFNGFPLLGSVLAQDRYAPKALNTRGDRLIYSNGVLILAFAAGVLLVIFQANVTSLIQLYIIGVFVSFTLGQSGMIRHWIRLLRTNPPNRGSIRVSLTINSIGATFTASVLIIVTVSKFLSGAYLVFLMMPILFLLMFGVNRYYRDVDKEIEADPTTVFGAKGDHAIVLVGKLQKPVLKALDYAIAARHDSVEALHVSIEEAETQKLQEQWLEQNIEVPLRVIESPYREVALPLIKYIRSRREEYGSEVVTIYTPLFIVGHWWESLLHNHKGRRIRNKLMLVHGVVIALVPWLLDSSELIYGRRSRPIPGQDRRGEPLRPVLRRPMPNSQTPQREARSSGGKQSPNAKRDAEKLAAQKKRAGKEPERAAVGSTPHKPK
jgi:amino acid transporter